MESIERLKKVLPPFTIWQAQFNLQFKRGDNSTYAFTKRGRGMYLVSATPTELLIEIL
jgi:hypothetical protein